MNGAAIIEAREAFANESFFNFIFFNGIIFCFGTLVFCLIEIRRLLAPKSPVNRGRRGSLRFRLREAIPKNPASMNIVNAQSFLFFS